MSRLRKRKREIMSMATSIMERSMTRRTTMTRKMRMLERGRERRSSKLRKSRQSARDWRRPEEPTVL